MPDFPYTDAVLNAQTDEDAARIAKVCLYTADPGTDGTGATPTTATPSWAAAGVVGPLGGSLQPATVGVAWGEATFTLAAGTYTFRGALGTADVFLGAEALAPSLVMGSGGTHQVSLAAGPVV